MNVAVVRQRGSRSRRRRRRLLSSLLGFMVVIIAGIALVAAVPPWRESALTAVLLSTGQIGAPAELSVATLCATAQEGGGKRHIPHIAVPPGRVVTGMLGSPALRGKSRPYYIYLPPGYQLPAFRHTRYPVVYVLHGAPGKAHDWLLGGQINIVADRLISSCRIVPMILVMPDGNGGLDRDSEYIRRWDGSEDVESYIVHDMVRFVDQHFRTIPQARFRAMMGLSEGGYGAVNLTIRHPDIFHAAASFTGYFRAAPSGVWLWDNPFGPNRRMMRANSPILRVPTLSLSVRRQLNILIYDGANDGDYSPEARAFAQVLRRYDVPYYWDSQVRAPLAVLYHTWTYWRDSARDALGRLSDFFTQAQSRASMTPT